MMKRTKNKSRFDHIPPDKGRGLAWQDVYPGIGRYKQVSPTMEAFRFDYYPVFRLPDGTFEVYGESPELSAALEDGLMKTFYAVALNEDTMRAMLAYIEGFVDGYRGGRKL